MAQAPRELRVGSADGVELAVLDAGARAGPAVVLIHGYPDTKEVWTGVIERLGAEHRVIAYDVRGAGDSDRPRGSAAYDLSRLGDDLIAVIDATAGERPAHLVGHDWGAIQGWEFATQPRVAERLASFTAIAGPSLDQVALGGRDLLSDGRLLEWLRRIRRSWYIAALLTPGLPTLAWRGLLGAARWERLLEARDELPPDPGYPRPSLAQDAIRGANLYRRNIPRRLFRPRADAVACVPVQLIVPSADRYISADYYERAELHAPSLRRHVLAGGHWLPRAHPEQVSALVAAFVADVEAGAVAGAPSRAGRRGSPSERAG